MKPASYLGKLAILLACFCAAHEAHAEPSESPVDTIPAELLWVSRGNLHLIGSALDYPSMYARTCKLLRNGRIEARYSDLPQLGLKLSDLHGIPIRRAWAQRLYLWPEQWSRLGVKIPPADTAGYPPGRLALTEHAQLPELHLSDLARIGWTLDSVDVVLADQDMIDVGRVAGAAPELETFSDAKGRSDGVMSMVELIDICLPDSAWVTHMTDPARSLGMRAVIRRDPKQGSRYGVVLEPRGWGIFGMTYESSHSIREHVSARTRAEDDAIRPPPPSSPPPPASRPAPTPLFGAWHPSGIARLGLGTPDGPFWELGALSVWEYSDWADNYRGVYLGVGGIPLRETELRSFEMLRVGYVSMYLDDSFSHASSTRADILLITSWAFAADFLSHGGGRWRTGPEWSFAFGTMGLRIGLLRGPRPDPFLFEAGVLLQFPQSWDWGAKTRAR